MKQELKDAKRDDVVKILQQFADIVRLYPPNCKVDLYIEVKKKG